MKLHLMASLRTHFNLRDEEINATSSDYEQFWQRAYEASSYNDNKFKSIQFLHRRSRREEQHSRFRSVDKDSLTRPLPILIFEVSPDNPVAAVCWQKVIAQFTDQQELLNKMQLIGNSINISLYDNCVALLQMDFDITKIMNEQKQEELANLLDLIQAAGIKMGEYLSRDLYQDSIKPFLQHLLELDNEASRFIVNENFQFKRALNNAVLLPSSTVDNHVIVVNWVTRTLLVESQDKQNLPKVIEHWLKDCGDQQIIDDARDNSAACAIRWLNYLFREDAYSWKTDGNGEINYTAPFSDEWQAMMNAQYYYATFEALNDSLRSTLSFAYQSSGRMKQKTISHLRTLNRALERDIVAANLAIIEYHNNFGYYNRNVGNVMKQIMAGWDFDEAILSQVKHNISLCEQRIAELHQKAASRSGFYSDILLLGIAVTSIVAFLFQLIEYGRNMSNDANLAIYESNSWNLVEFVSERPTDFIITLSLGIIIVLFVLYSWFRRVKVMD